MLGLLELNLMRDKVKKKSKSTKKTYKKVEKKTFEEQLKDVEKSNSEFAKWIRSKNLK